MSEQPVTTTISYDLMALCLNALRLSKRISDEEQDRSEAFRMCAKLHEFVSWLEDEAEARRTLLDTLKCAAEVIQSSRHEQT